ncbi:MAG: DUF3656 domain-containing protein [Porcipelethomonas sp.]
MSSPEILAPAGSMESLEAALRCGADAVYVGGSMFSARQNALNFTMDELELAARRCHLYGASIHLAVNTVIFDSQAEEFAEFIRQSAEIGIDAYIVQDLGALRIIREVVSPAVLHASTQMTIHTAKGAEFARSMGFQRVVLSRELDKNQIKEICDTGIETEVFVHGALCMSVSGQCYLSALIGQRSANRGQCAQPCRLPFSACGNRNFCALSLKDLSLANHMNELKALGVSSLKIEGRMKRPEYVAAAVTAFRAAADGNPPDMDNLRAVFSRSGFTNGYFTGKRQNMFGTREKDDVTAAKDVLPKLRQLYKNEGKAGTVSFRAEIKENSPFMLYAQDEKGNSVSVRGEIPEKAQKKAVDKEFLTRQLSKLGDTVFTLGDLSAEIDEGLSVSAGMINEARRSAVKKLSEKRIKGNTAEYSTFSFRKVTKNREKNLTEIRARISSANQLDAAEAADRIIIPADEFLRNDIAPSDRIIIEPPRFIADEKSLTQMLKKIRQKGAAHLMCSNPAYIETGKALGFELHGDFGLNISNSYSLDTLQELGLRDALLSFELKLSQIQDLASEINTGIIAYGHLPAMLVRNCPVKNEAGCGKCRHRLTDRTGRDFEIVCHGDHAELLNSQCLYMADKLSEIRNVNFITLYFTHESPDIIGKTIESYKNCGKKRENITRGLYYRGVLI